MSQKIFHSNWCWETLLFTDSVASCYSTMRPVSWREIITVLRIKKQSSAHNREDSGWDLDITLHIRFLRSWNAQYSEYQRAIVTVIFCRALQLPVYRKHPAEKIDKQPGTWRVQRTGRAVWRPDLLQTNAGWTASSYPWIPLYQRKYTYCALVKYIWVLVWQPNSLNVGSVYTVY